MSLHYHPKGMCITGKTRNLIKWIERYSATDLQIHEKSKRGKCLAVNVA